MSERLRRLVDSFVVDVRREKGPPPAKSQCRRVTRVSPASLAARAGIVPGDYFASLDGSPAEGFREIDWLACDQDPIDYTFYSPTTRERVHVRAKKADAGFETEATPEAIVDAFARNAGDFYDLKILWEQGRWRPLHEISRTMEFGPPEEPKGLLGRLFGSKKPKEPEGLPTLLFLGAAIWEMGDPDAGWPLIAHYLDESGPKWTTDFFGIGLSYAAQVNERTGDSATALEMIEEAWRLSESPRVGKAFAARTGRSPEAKKPRWLGKAFPERYALPMLEGAGDVRLLDALASLPDQGLLGVCCLSSYRANGPYDEAMGRWRNQAHYCSEWIRGLHVLTSNAGGRDTWLRNERRCIAEKLPVQVLLDERNEVSEALELEASPHLFVLRKDGVVVHEGRLRSVEFWDMLAAHVS